jgi:hypothetical protein
MGTPLEEDLVDVPGPTHWPEVPAADAETGWEELRSWVEGLCERFSFIDRHVVPRCWWLHNEHVEALVALRDHERSSFEGTAPATAPVEWLRALRDITSLLRAWSGELACGASHYSSPAALRPARDDEWRNFVADDVAAREAAEVHGAAG